MRKLTANDWLARAAQVTQIAARTMARQDHIIICGYGRSGQNLARLLEAEEIPYVAMDSDPERVREAAADGSSVVYGDASRREVAGQRRPRQGARGGDHVRQHAGGAQDPPSRPQRAARTAGDRAHGRRPRDRPAARGRRDRGRPGGARGQPDARVALAAAARRSAQSRARSASARFARSATACSAASSTARPTPRTRPTTCRRACIPSCCPTARRRSAARWPRSSSDGRSR